MSSQRSLNMTSSLRRFSTLAGPLNRLNKREQYQVRFVQLNSGERFLYRFWTQILAYGALFVVISFAVILFRPANWVVFIHPDSQTHLQNWLMLLCLLLLQVFVLIRTLAATRATVRAKNPVPVTVPSGLQVALSTTRAPGEPYAMVENTLRAALRVHYSQGSVTVWLLDETNDSDLKHFCKELGVRYFSRARSKQWNTVRPRGGFIRKITGILFLSKLERQKITAYNGQFDARTKHGNYNAWRAYLAKHKISYDILAGIDTDQVPQTNFLTRLLGYFNDPNVAFVVGPQVYGNYHRGLSGLVARWAESQASFFQSTIQRAGNASQSAMFVGTNYAVRMPVLDQIGGFQPCITEDMATGLAIHAARNEATGQHWKSVYTPDVLAIGEGPSFWGPYFSQQYRWAAGTYDTWRRLVWRVAFKLPRRALLHYFLMLTFYPMAALSWLLACVSSGIYLTSGATAVLAPWTQFLSLYLLAAVMQLSLYFWNRRYNVSPHEPAGSFGVSGMVLTSLVAPVYLAAFIGALVGKKTSFVVTSKSLDGNPDWFKTFKLQAYWAVVIISFVIYGVLHNRNNFAMLLWAFIVLLICAAPIVMGMRQALKSRPLSPLKQPKQSHQQLTEASNA